MTRALKNAQEFQDDFTEMVLAIRTMAEKYELPSPVLLFTPAWDAPIRCMPIAATSEFNPHSVGPRTFMAVRYEFGQLRQELVLRP